MTAQTVVYAGYKVGDTEIAVDDNGRFYIIEDEVIRPYVKNANPLAHKHGALMMQVLVHSMTQYANLTVAQRRCLDNPETRHPRPWATLVARGLADNNGLTAFGEFVAIVDRRGAMQEATR